MEIKKRYEQIAECFPEQRKTAKISNLDVLNTAPYIVENGLQMEKPAQRIRRLARDLCPDKPLGEKRSFGKSIFAFAATGNHPNPSKRGQFGFHLH